MRITLLSLALLSPILLAAPQDPAASEPESPLTVEMEGLKTQLKTLAMNLREPSKRDTCLAAVATMQQHLLTAKLLAPSNIEEQPKADKSAHALAFRKDMNQVLGTVVELERNLLEADVDAAWEKITGPLYKLREAAHKRYKSK